MCHLVVVGWGLCFCINTGRTLNQRLRTKSKAMVLVVWKDWEYQRALKPQIVIQFSDLLYAFLLKTKMKMTQLKLYRAADCLWICVTHLCIFILSFIQQIFVAGLICVRNCVEVLATFLCLLMLRVKGTVYSWILRVIVWITMAVDA